MTKFDDAPSMRKDGVVKEVIGKVDDISLKDKCLVIKSKTDGKYTFGMNSIALRQLVSLAKIPSSKFGIKNGQKNLLGSDFNRLDEKQQKEVIELIKSNVDNVLFRSRTKYGKWLCFAVLSQKYNKIKADDLNKKAREIYKDTVVFDLDKSNGYFAGTLYIRFPVRKNDIAGVVIALGAEKLDGYNSNKIVGQAHITKSGYTLIFEPRDIIKKIAKIVDERKLYVNEFKDNDMLKAKIDKVADTTKDIIIENISFSKKVELTHAMQVEVALHYMKSKMLCKRNWVKVAKVLFGGVDIHEDSQLPDTNVWVFINAFLTVANESSGIKKGVKTNLERIAGELLIVASRWDQFVKIAKVKIPKI